MAFKNLRHQPFGDSLLERFSTDDDALIAKDPMIRTVGEVRLKRMPRRAYIRWQKDTRSHFVPLKA